MGRDFWKKDFWKVAMASMLGLAPAAMALDVGGAIGWPKGVTTPGGINVVSDPTTDPLFGNGNVHTTGPINVRNGTAVGVGNNGGSGVLSTTGSYVQTGGTFSVAATTDSATLALMLIDGGGSIEGGKLLITTTNVTSGTAAKAHADFEGGMTTVGASGTIQITNTGAGTGAVAGARHQGGLTVFGKYEVVSDGAGNANAVIGHLTGPVPAATNIQAGGTFLVHNKGTKGTGAQDMAIATHTGGLTIGGTYTIKSDGDGSANSVVSGGDLSVLAGGKLEIVNADTGGAYMAVTGTANLNGTVIIKNTGALSATTLAAGLKASVAVNIGSGADIQITTENVTAHPDETTNSSGWVYVNTP